MSVRVTTKPGIALTRMFIFYSWYQPNWMKCEIVYAIKQRNHFHKKGDYFRFKIWRQNVRWKWKH